jgi:hypothetical protein
MTMLTRGQMSEVRSQKAKSRGAAIMLALWALFLLSALVISWALDINTRLSLSGDATRMLKAEAVACSGAEVALHPFVKPDSPNLSGQLDNGASYEARITGEGGRLDLNWFVAGEDPDKLEVLRRYLKNKGIDLNERDTMIDSLLDWVEPNVGLHHLNAPPESDTYHPPHAGGLARVEELKQVAGWQDFTSAPGWDDDFTVNTRMGVDMTWASRDVLLALPGMTPEIVDRFLQLRQGPDGIDGTADDMVFKSNDEILVTMGFRQDQIVKLKNSHVLAQAPVLVFRVVSVGTAGKATRTVQMVFQRVGTGVAVITWKEF